MSNDESVSVSSNPSTVYPDCMQGPSEPCAGYTQLLNHAEAHRREAERLTKALRIAEIKASGTLANNLCPDHRDKQTGKPCLACEIERLRGERDEAREAYTDENLQKHGLIGKYGRMRVLLREAKQSVLKAADADCVCVDGPQRCKYCLPHRALAERIDAALSGASPAVETSESLCAACGHGDGYHFDDGQGNVVCRWSADCACIHRAESLAQAPIARLTIKEDPCHWCKEGVPLSKDGYRHESDSGVWVCMRNRFVEATLYAPGLPPGEHDLYCEPEKLTAPYMRERSAEKAGEKS